MLTLDVPERCALLSDFDCWHVLLNDGELIFPYSDDAVYSETEKRKSWENIFDISCSYDMEKNCGISFMENRLPPLEAFR